MKAKYYDTNGELEGIGFVQRLTKFQHRGNNLLTGIDPSDLPEGVKFNQGKHYMFRYELKHREKDCAHYYCIGVVEMERGEFTLEPFYPRPKAGEMPICLGWDNVNE